MGKKKKQRIIQQYKQTNNLHMLNVFAPITKPTKKGTTAPLTNNLLLLLPSPAAGNPPPAKLVFQFQSYCVLLCIVVVLPKFVKQSAQ